MGRASSRSEGGCKRRDRDGLEALVSIYLEDWQIARKAGAEVRS